MDDRQNIDFPRDSEACDCGDADEEILHPSGRYDSVIRLIESFPLRILLFFIGASVCLEFRKNLNELTHVVPPVPFGAKIMYVLTAGLVIGELATGYLTRIIKDALVRWVMAIEEKAQSL